MNNNDHITDKISSRARREDIDIVYLWCDMSDPLWNANRKAVAEKWKEEVTFTDDEAVGRYQSHNELLYSLRSMEMYAPWINNAFIVVNDDNTLPSWLNTSNPRLHIVRLSEIIPPEFLPCYNSSSIEHFISSIPELSERFLYSNDDMFFFDSVTPDMFFDCNNNPIVRVIGNRYTLQVGKYYEHSLYKGYKLVTTAHPEVNAETRNLLLCYPHHCADSYRKSHSKETFNRYKEDILQAISCPFRNRKDIQRALYLMEEVATFGARTVCDTFGHPFSMDLDGTKSWRRGLDNALRYRPKLLCINAWHDNTPDDFEWLRLAMETLFPAPSSFEK